MVNIYECEGIELSNGLKIVEYYSNYFVIKDDEYKLLGNNKKILMKYLMDIDEKIYDEYISKYNDNELRKITGRYINYIHSNYKSKIKWCRLLKYALRSKNTTLLSVWYRPYDKKTNESYCDYIKRKMTEEKIKVMPEVSCINCRYYIGGNK